MATKGQRHPLDKGDGRFFSNVKIQDAGYFAKYSHEDGGEETRLVIQLQPGGGNILHYHNTFVERFVCNKGLLGVEMGSKGETRHLKPGEDATIPISTHHRFFNDSKEMVEFTTTLTPGSRGFEQSIFIVYGLANDGLTDDKGVPKSFIDLCVIAKMGDIYISGVAGYVMNPLMSAAYEYARWAGVEKKLIEKYCPQQLRE